MKKHFSVELSRLVTDVRISVSAFIHRFTFIGKTIFVFPFISALLLQSAAWAGWPQPVRLESWTDLDEVVAAGYSNLTNQALLYPPTALTGWQVIAPSGRTGELSSVTLSRSAPAALSADEINAALSMTPPSAPPKTASFDIGLAPTLSAGSTDRVAELARALDYNWLNCYSFVRDNIRFVPYADIVRGAVRTLIDREGNSADQSFLLLALLRASGYDATIFYDPYFHVPFTDSATGYDAANWLGISASGTPAEIQQRIFNILDRAGLHPAFDLGETPDESYVALHHFFVGVELTAGSYTLLDPSFTPQDLSVDSSLFHGYYTTETIIDFFSQPENYRDYFRGWIQVLHSEFSWWCWLDELGDRGLWLTYTNMAGYTSPRLTLYLDDERVAYDTSSAGRLTDNIYINVKHPSVMSYVEADYLLKSAVTNLYAIPVGFGSTTPDGMRGVTAKKLAECNTTSPPEWHCQRSAMLHALGHHYLYQSSMINSLQSRIGGYTYNTFFDIGISGQEQTSFFDFKNGLGFISLEEKPSLYGERIFASALEHSVLDQNNSENQPAVSTVRLLEIANTQGIPIYQADSGNWAPISSSLINYGNYDSRQRFSDNASGRGWSHGYDSRVTVHTDPDAFIGRDMPASAAASIVACTVVSDLVLTNTAKTLTTACLVTKWWTDQLLNNAATITADGSALSFCRLPDGSYEPQSGVTATLTGSETTGFTPGGRKAWREDRDGAYHQFFYDFFGHMVTNIDAVGREQLFVYDDDNHLLSITEAANTPDSRATSFAYDDGHHLIAITNALGRVTRMSYDSCDRLALLSTPDGVSVTNHYTAEGLLAASRTLAPNGATLRESSFVYNTRGLPATTTATDAGTTTFSYDSAGNVTGIIDARGNTRAFAYDPRGFATNAVNALGHSAFSLFSAAGRPLATTDPLGRTTAFQWTPGGKPAATIFADGAMLTNHYDAADRLVSVTDPRNATLTFNLDVAGRATNRVTATWSDYTWYDLAGVVTTRQDAVSGRTDIASDWLDRPVAVIDPLSNTRLAYYDPLNSVTNTVDPRGRSTRHTYDVMGRLAQTTRPSGYVESYGRDALGRTTAFTNAEGRVTTQSFDAQNRLLSTVNAAGERLFLNRYDHLGNLTNRLDGANNASVYAYDALNRNTSVTYADNTTETFAYDKVGNLTAANNGTVSNAFVYDAMNRLVNSEVRIQNSEVSFETAYAYDPGGLITNIVYPGNKTLHYAYDTDGRLTSVTDWNSRTFTFSHDAAGRRTSLTYPNGVSGTYTYDATHNLTSWQYAKGGAPLTGRTISRDAVGLKTGESVTAGLFPNPTQPRRMQNTFDVADRLTAAVVYSGTNTYNETYQYNASGALTNRVSLQSAVVSHHSAYTYDLAGRFSGYNSQFFIHNSQFSVCYDALGNRTKTVQDGTTRLWVTDHADPLKRPLMEADADGTPVRYYLWGGGQLLAVVEVDGTTHYTHSDELGSIVALTDSTGTITDQFSYGPYGENWGRTGTTEIPFRWLGSHGVFAATPANSPLSILHSQLYLTRYRAYDAYTGRFLSSDPLGLGGGPNLYAYCLGNPLSYIDPLGLCGESINWSDVWEFLLYGADGKEDTIKKWDAIYEESLNRTIGQQMKDIIVFGLLGKTPKTPYEQNITEIGTMVMLGTVAPGSVPSGPAGSLSKPSASWLKNQGVDPHVVKQVMPGGRMDLYVDKAGNLWVKGKNVADKFAEFIGRMEWFK